VRLIQQILRAFFQQLYTNFSWGYDIVAWVSSMGQWRTWQDAGAESLRSGPVLEIGFGTGQLMYALARRGHIVIGLDPSPQMVSIAKRAIADSEPRPSLIRSFAENIPIRGEQFDQVITTFPSDYILRSETLREVFRVLRKGGRFVIIPGVSEITGPRDRSHRWLRFLDGIASWIYRLTGEQTDANHLWQEELSAQFSEVGFSTEISFVQQPRATVLRIIAIKQY
jgi:ubiquinone/menaquinone biosynthesis C-methylase UbiE